MSVFTDGTGNAEVQKENPRQFAPPSLRLMCQYSRSQARFSPVGQVAPKRDPQLATSFLQIDESIFFTGLPDQASRAGYRRRISPRRWIARSIAAVHGCPQLMRKKLRNCWRAENIGPGAMLMPMLNARR